MTWSYFFSWFFIWFHWCLGLFTLLSCNFHTLASGFAGKYSKNELVEYYSETHGEWCFGKQTARFVRPMSLRCTMTLIWCVIFSHSASKKCEAAEAQVTCNSDSKQRWWLLGNGEVDVDWWSDAGRAIWQSNASQVVSSWMWSQAYGSPWRSDVVPLEPLALHVFFCFFLIFESLNCKKDHERCRTCLAITRFVFFAHFALLRRDASPGCQIQGAKVRPRHTARAFVVENFAVKLSLFFFAKKRCQMFSSKIPFLMRRHLQLQLQLHRWALPVGSP